MCCVAWRRTGNKSTSPLAGCPAFEGGGDGDGRGRELLRRTPWELSRGRRLMRPTQAAGVCGCFQTALNSLSWLSFLLPHTQPPPPTHPHAQEAQGKGVKRERARDDERERERNSERERVNISKSRHTFLSVVSCCVPEQRGKILGKSH